MDHFYNPNISVGSLQLDEEESKHCIRVLRKKTGDKIIILDGKGGTFTCRITNPHIKKTEFEIVGTHTTVKPNFLIQLAIAPTKNIERIEWFLEKTIEIGIQRIAFLQCENSERKQVKMERMIKKAINAMKQSQNPFLPDIVDILPFNDYVLGANPEAEKFICHANNGRGKYLFNTATKGCDYQVLIGPEGDFSENELHLADEKGFRSVSLGKSRLRTETAGVVACTLLNAINIER